MAACETNQHVVALSKVPMPFGRHLIFSTSQRGLPHHSFQAHFQNEVWQKLPKRVNTTHARLDRHDPWQIQFQSEVHLTQMIEDPSAIECPANCPAVRVHWPTGESSNC